jgi:hypothetical protein
MQPSKNLAIAFLLGAVTVGGALGFAADRVMMRGRIEQPGGSYRARLADRLQLDASQRGLLDSILDDRHRRYSIVMSTVNPALDSIKQRARDDIRHMLSERQRAEFEKMLTESSDNTKRPDDN